MKISFNPSNSNKNILDLIKNNKDIIFDLKGHSIFARGVEFKGTDTNTWRDIKINNVSIGSHTLDLRNGSNTTLTNTNGVVTINSTWRPVVDNLTSDSTTSSLSAKQGKVLKALIDGKSNSDHNHDGRYLKLTGGTMASNALITFADSGSWDTSKKPQGARGGLYWTGQSDYAKLYAEETVGDNLDLVIQFGDDNSNGLSIRNKANTQTSYISSSGVITTGTFKGNLDWSYITNKPATATRWPSWAEVTGKPSSFTPSTHTHGLSNSVFFLNMPSINGNAKWKEVFGYPVNYNLLLSVRINNPAPEWCVGNFGSGILYGGSDTKGFMSSAYNEPFIMWAGGNGSSDDSVPKWYIGIKGTHKSIYNLATIASEANAAYNLRHSHANKSVLDGITSALVNSWNTAYNFVSNITGTDTDKVINKWEEIVNFLAGITEDNKLNTLLNSKLSIQQLSAKDILTTKTNNALFWVDTKGNASTITTGPFTDHPYALLSVTNYNQNAENHKFFYRSRLAFSSAGDIKVASCHHEYEYQQDETWYNVLTSKNSGINGSTIKLNGTSITVYSSGTADGRYVKKSGDTMQGVLTIDTTNFGALTIKRNDDANGASIQFRGKSSVYGYIGLNNSTKDKQFLRWSSDISRVYTILDTSSTYISNGKGVINGTTITQVDNATNSTNSTNARKLVNWYSARPTSLNAQFGDGSLRIFYATSSTTEGKPAEDSHILHLAWDNTGGYDAQLAVHTRSGKVSTRAQNGGTWQPWKTLAFTTDIPSSLKNPYSFNVFGVVYDGSAAKTVTTSNFISQVNEGTSTITDGTMLITSYATNSGFADTNAVNVPYKRKAIHLWEYIKTKTDSLYATKGHNHDGRYVRAFGTSNDNIDSDWGQSFKTFDPIPLGTPPEKNPNISLLSIGENFNRRKQLAFIWNNDNIYYRRHIDSGFTNWRRLAFANEIPTSLKNPYALTISLNGTSQGPYDGSAAKNINITPGSIGAAVSNHSHDYLVVNSADDKSFNSAYHNFQVLYAGGDNKITGKPANVDAFGLFKFRAASGWSGQMLLANGGSLYIRSSEDAKMTNTLAWKTILDSSNYSGILDSRYYTESEVNSLLDAKLNRQNLSYGNWNPRGYHLAADYHYNGGDLSISESGGKIHVSVDGYFWQNEGQYRVLDTSDIGDIRDSVTLHQYLSATDAAWYPLVWGGASHNNTSDSTGPIYKSYDKLCWQTSSQTLYATNIQTNNIKNLSIGGGIYWNPNVESATDGSDVASITLVRSGVAGGTTLVLSQMNDTNDTIQFKTNTAARLYHNSYPILTTQNTYVSNNKGYINGLEITQVNNADKVDNRHAISTTPNTGIIYKAAIYTSHSLTSYWVRLASIPSIGQNGEFVATIHVQSGHSNPGRSAILLVYLRGNASSFMSKSFKICCNSNYDPNRFRLYYKDSDKTSEIWYQTTGQWDGIITTVISQSAEGYLYEGLTLYSGSITAVQTPSVSTYLSAQVSTITDNISGNASTATKLQTARSIWGQSFDGTGNVSGSLSEVGNIHFKVDNSYDIGSDAAASRYIYTHWLGARSGRKLELGANNSGFGQGLCIDTNLNVGINTNTPAYKLHVVGDIYTTTGFKKNGSSDSYVLLGGGGHKAESSLRVAYASNADMVDGYHENSFLRYRGATNTDQEATLWSQIGIKEYYGALPDGLTDTYNWGGVISLPGTHSRFEIYASHWSSSSGNGLYYRSGWDSDKKTWLKLIDSSTIGSQTVANAYHLRINSANTWSTWYWAGQSGQPSWLWGSNDGTNMYVWNPSNFNVNTAQYLRSLGNQNCQTGRTQAYGDVYSYNTYNGNTGSPTTYSSVIGFGRGIAGTVEIAGGWSNTHLYWRSLRDCCEDWFPWRTVLDSSNYTEFINNYYWANVKISASSSTTTSPTVHTLTATRVCAGHNPGIDNSISCSNWFRSSGNTGWYNTTYQGGWYMSDTSWIRAHNGVGIYTSGQIYSSSSIRMSNILLEHTDEINNSANGGIHLNYRNSGNVSLCYGGGNVGIGTTTPSYKLDVNGQMRASGFHHASVNSDNYMLLAGGGYKSFGGDDSTPIFLGCLDLYRGGDGTISSSFYCLGYSVPFTYTRGGNYCKIVIPDTTRLSFYIIAATASVNYSGGGMDTWTGYHRGSGAWWLHCYAFGWNEVRVKGFCQAGKNNDSWWGGNPLWNNEYGANRITVCIFGNVKYK